MKNNVFLFFLIVSCLLLVGCSAGTPEEQEQLAQALQSLEQEYEDSNSSGWEDFVSQLEGDAKAEETSEASWADVLHALKEANEEEKVDGETTIPWGELKDILSGGEVKTPTPTLTVTPTPTPMPTATPEPAATPTPEPESEEEDDGFHLYHKIVDFLY